MNLKEYHRVLHINGSLKQKGRSSVVHGDGQWLPPKTDGGGGTLLMTSQQE